MSESDPNATDALTAGPRGAPVRLKLLVVEGPDAGRELLLERGTYRIGKEPGNDLVLADSAVSRTHLIVAVLQHGVRVTDNQSKNGAFMDGMRFTSLDARPGTTMRIGRTSLKILPAEARASVPPSSSDRFGELVGRSVKMREVFGVLERLAKADADVLIHGETGTGKELCAEGLHRASKRASAPFVICDLAGVTPTLLESELFGHVKGAFTGAHADRAGAFEQAHGGTLFLDEVGELPLEAQPRLLRALERRQVKRVGSNSYRTVQLRVIAATHKDLQAEVAAGKFRADLFHRLAVARVTLPPLRDRPEDIPTLIDTLLEKMGKEHSELSASTRALLEAYDWPGNVRELRNVIEQSVSLDQQPELAVSPRVKSSGASADASLPFKEAKEKLVHAFERDYLAQLMRACEGNLSKASREAGIDRVHLRKLLKKHGLRDVEEG